MGQLAAQTMAGCRVTWPNACRRWLPVWLPRDRRTRAAAEALRLITAGQVIGTLQAARRRHAATTAATIAVALDDDVEGALADEAVRSGIGGTD